MFAETECGKVSLAMLNSVQALPHLAFLPSMEPPLVFWYDRQLWMRTVDGPTRGGAAVTFNEILSQTIAMLHQHGRVSYRALKRQFALADDVLADLTYELTEVQQLAVDQDGTVLVLTGFT
jgi:hypothetical protein